jgi:hypothetical protein
MALERILWIGGTTVSVVFAANFAFFGAHMWLRSRSVLGPVSAEDRQTLRSLVGVSRQGNSLEWTRLVLLYTGLGTLLVALAAHEPLGLIVAAAPFVVMWWMHIRTTTAPAALLLGTSTHTSIRRQRDVKRRLSPLRVVSLLDIAVPRDPGLASEMALDCFRTTDEDDWWLVITRLMKMVPVIAIDTAAETTGVLREGTHILGTELVRKCLFLTPPDGSTPILDRLLPAAGLDLVDLRFARYEEAPRVLAAMVADLVRRGAGEPRRQD